MLSPTRKLWVLPGAAHLCASPSNRSLLPPSSTTVFSILFRRSQFPRARCHVSCPAAPSRHGFFLRRQHPGLLVVGKNQTRVPQPTQQVWMFVCKELESSGFVRLSASNIQHNCGEAGNLRIVRLRHALKAGHILFERWSCKPLSERNKTAEQHGMHPPRMQARRLAPWKSFRRLKRSVART